MTLQTSKGNSKIRIQYQKTNGQSHNRYTVRKNSLSLMIYNKEIKNFKKNKRRTQKNKVASSSGCLNTVFKTSSPRNLMGPFKTKKKTQLK